MSASVTIRIRRKDKERLVRLAKKPEKKKLSEAFRLALSAAEHETESNFRGNIKALIKLHDLARDGGGNGSEKVDEELGKVLYDEVKSGRRNKGHSSK